ncbi:unnamed protein product [Lactuca saligna]|uniref:QWRF motif-containing protein 3 n=1 Tax=Lactuca saligna TaxID=75948 RepID=A0AA35Z6N3_LACSI|nr:unnamed protein product [Lactuca saligna]
MMVVSISETLTNQTRRRPLLSSEKDHSVITLNNSTRHISSSSSNSNSKSSSLLTPTPPRRSPSRLVSRDSITPAVKRSVSADRRRPAKPDLNLKCNNAGREVSMSAAAKLLLTSTRNLSVSFQGEASSLPVNKTKRRPNLNNVRKGIPERKTTGSPLRRKVEDHGDNTKPMDQHWWPCKTHQATNTIFSKSFNVEKSKVIESRNVIRALHQSIDGGGRSSLDLGNAASDESKLVASQKFGISKKFIRNRPLSSPRTMASACRMRSGSQSVLMTSSMDSIRNSGTITTDDTRSVLSFAFEGGRKKVGEKRILDAHMLRLLYNRQLQWRYVNARTEDILLKRKHRTEKYLWNTWVTTSDLHDSVTKKRHRLQLLRQKLKLASIIKQQMGFLEKWACSYKDHSRSLLGAIKDLKGNTLRLPVDGGATANIQSMKDAISSAMVVIQAMGSSIHSLCLKAEEVNSLVMELANVSAKERALIRICKDFLFMLMALKVKDCSLRTHLLQKV